MQSRNASIVSDMAIRDEFASLPVNSKLTKVAEILALNQVKIILATEGNKKKEVIGVISEQHFLKVCASGINPEKTKIQDHMQTNILRLLDNTPIDAAIRLVEETKPDAVIVMDSNRKFRGFVSPEDYFKIKNDFLDKVIGDHKFADDGFFNPKTREPAVAKSMLKVEINSGVANKKNRGKISTNEINQMVQLTQHHCSDIGRTNQLASRTGLPHEHLLCVRQYGPADISGIWAISDSQIEEILTNQKKSDLFYVTMVENDSSAPPSWLAGIDFISSKYSLQMNINCLLINKENLLSPPTVSQTKSKAKKSTVKIAPLVQELMDSLISKSSSKNDNFLLCAAFQTG